MAENGEIVAAMLEDGATVKRLKKNQLSVLLCPENRAYEPIDVTCREDFRVLGKVIHRVGRVMGIKTIAEYVESEAILEKLREIQVDFAQGFAIARPLPMIDHIASNC